MIACLKQKDPLQVSSVIARSRSATWQSPGTRCDIQRPSRRFPEGELPRRGKRSHPGVRAYALGMTWLSFRGSSQPFHYQSGSARIDRGHYRLTKEKAQPFGRAWWTGCHWIHSPADCVSGAIGLFRGLKKCPPDTFLPCIRKAALFESYIWNTIPKNKTHPIGWVLFFGGRYRTRTYDLPHVKRML